MNNTIFNRDFYPTPDNVIEMMLQNSDISNKVILEPSAGKGNIVDYLLKNGAKEVIACEKQPDLQRILSTKCQIISDDFLKVTEEQVSHIDMIVMNPPFSADENHILHAYKIAPAGCEIIALCNSSSLSNSFYNKRQQLLEIVEMNGHYEELGACFKNAERQTDVYVSCIRMFKQGEKNKNEWDGYFSLEEDEFDENQQEGLMRYDFIRDLVQRYVDAVSMYDTAMDINNRINQKTEMFSKYGIKFGAYNPNSHYSNVTRDTFKKQLQKDAWNFIFRKLDMQKYVTSSVMNDINTFIEQQVNVPFTMRNIYKMLQLIVGTQADRMDKCLCEAFDLICSFSAENSTAGEKWKTNSEYMINKRFIVPYICNYDKQWPCGHVKICYGGYSNKIEDIIKALCYITGKNYNEQISLGDFCREFKPAWGAWLPMGHYKYKEGCNPEYIGGFFRIKGHKKGTMHFEFLDDKVWEMFNRKVSEIKGWRLPKTRTNKQAKKQTEVVLF